VTAVKGATGVGVTHDRFARVFVRFSATAQMQCQACKTRVSDHAGKADTCYCKKCAPGALKQLNVLSFDACDDWADDGAEAYIKKVRDAMVAQRSHDLSGKGASKTVGFADGTKPAADGKADAAAAVRATWLTCVACGRVDAQVGGFNMAIRGPGTSMKAARVLRDGETPHCRVCSEALHAYYETQTAAKQAMANRNATPEMEFDIIQEWAKGARLKLLGSRTIPGYGGIAQTPLTPTGLAASLPVTKISPAAGMMTPGQTATGGDERRHELALVSAFAAGHHGGAGKALTGLTGIHKMDTLLRRAKEPPATDRERLRQYEQLTYYDRHDKKVDAVLIRDEFDELRASDLRDLRVEEARSFRTIRNRLDPLLPTTVAEEARLKRAPEKERKLLEVDTYRYAEGLARRIATITKNGAPLEAAASAKVYALAQEGVSRLRNAQKRQWLVIKGLFYIESIEDLEATRLGSDHFLSESQMNLSAPALQRMRATKALETLKKSQKTRAAKRAKPTPRKGDASATLKSKLRNQQSELRSLQKRLRDKPPLKNPRPDKNPRKQPWHDKGDRVWEEGCAHCKKAGNPDWKRHGKSGCFELNPKKRPPGWLPYAQRKKRERDAGADDKDVD
jgi:hypothetical protein